MIHNVYFWLRADLTEEEKTAFLISLKTLGNIDTVRGFFYGPPSSTEAREVVDNSFSYSISVHFDDIAGQNAYQIDPIHLKFVEDSSDKWVRVQVYDNDLI